MTLLARRCASATVEKLLARPFFSPDLGGRPNSMLSSTVAWLGGTPLAPRRSLAHLAPTPAAPSTPLARAGRPRSLAAVSAAEPGPSSALAVSAAAGAAQNASSSSSSSSSSSRAGSASSSRGTDSAAAVSATPRRSSGGGSSGGGAKTDLVSIKGVGPVYENLLLLHGVGSVQTLQERFHMHLNSDVRELQDFLQKTVGIKNGQHCTWVAEHIRSLDWEPPQRQRQRVTLAVEGNIGAGKSTFLSMLERLELLEVQVVHEPVDEWQGVVATDPEGQESCVNVLEKFYSDPSRYAFTFQNYVLLSRINKERRTRAGTAPLRVLERSIFSDRMVFVRAMHEAGRMEDWELKVYDSWFSTAVAQDREVAPSGFIYLRAQPETCIERMRRRNRGEEAGVEPAYLEQLHRHHEDWLGPQLSRVEGADIFKATSQLQYSGLQQRDDSAVWAAMGGSGGLRAFRPEGPEGLLLPDDSATLRQLFGPEAQPDSIRGKVVFLHGKNANMQLLGDMLNGTPALILDHDHDSLHDLDAQKWQAKQVADFFKYVRRLKEHQAATQPPALSLNGAAPPFTAAPGLGLAAGAAAAQQQLLADPAAVGEMLQRLLAQIDQAQRKINSKQQAVYGTAALETQSLKQTIGDFYSKLGQAAQSAALH